MFPFCNILLHSFEEGGWGFETGLDISYGGVDPVGRRLVADPTAAFTSLSIIDSCPRLNPLGWSLKSNIWQLSVLAFLLKLDLACWLSGD